MKSLFTRLAALALVVAPFAIINTPAQATASDSFAPTGSSWVTVPMADRHYFVDAGISNGSYFDDYGVGLLPTGASCSDRFSSAVPGDLVATGSSCVNSNQTPLQSADYKIPFGFDVNFFGTTYSGGWLNTNGGLTFDQPTSAYDYTLFDIAASANTTGIFPLAMDLVHSVGISHLWYAHTTIDGKAAFVASWENYLPCCSINDLTKGNASFQLVLINQGSGNFDAWFNYDNFSITSQGYSPFSTYTDLHNGVTNGSNIVTVRNVTNFPTGCVSLSTSFDGFNGATTPSWASGLYGQLQSSTDRTLALFSDSTCTTPVSASPMPEGNYLDITASTAQSFRAAGIGWDSYSSTTGISNSTEFFGNQDVATLINADSAATANSTQAAGSNPLNRYSLNTTVPGRIVLGQRGGVTVGDPTAAGAVLPLVPTSGTNEITTGSAQAIESDGTTTSVPLVLSSGGSNATVTHGGLTMTMVGSPDSADGTIAVSPTTGVTVSGSGFKPNSDVNVWVFSAATHLGIAHTNSHGSFSKRFGVPSSLAAGIHTLQAQGKNPAGQVRALAAKLKISSGALAHTGLNTGLIGAIAFSFIAMGALAMFEIRRRFYN